LASFRPLANLLIFTRNKNLLTQLSLVWGVRAYYYESSTSTDATFMDIQDQLKKDGYVKIGDIIINTASMPLKEKGKTNMLKIHLVE
jgi:pyruvate kinase